MINQNKIVNGLESPDNGRVQHKMGITDELRPHLKITEQSKLLQEKRPSNNFGNLSKILKIKHNR